MLPGLEMIVRKGCAYSVQILAIRWETLAPHLKNFDLSG